MQIYGNGTFQNKSGKLISDSCAQDYSSKKFISSQNESESPSSSQEESSSNQMNSSSNTSDSLKINLRNGLFETEGANILFNTISSESILPKFRSILEQQIYQNYERLRQNKASNLHFNNLPLSEILHHPYHGDHKPDCRLTCTCGLLMGETNKINYALMNPYSNFSQSLIQAQHQFPWMYGFPTQPSGFNLFQDLCHDFTGRLNEDALKQQKNHRKHSDVDIGQVLQNKR